MGTCFILGRGGWINPSFFQHLQLVRTMVGNDSYVHGFWNAYENMEERKRRGEGKIG